jgi:hypothetical protein
VCDDDDSNLNFAELSRSHMQHQLNSLAASPLTALLLAYLHAQRDLPQLVDANIQVAHALDFTPLLSVSGTVQTLEVRPPWSMLTDEQVAVIGGLSSLTELIVEYRHRSISDSPQALAMR